MRIFLEGIYYTLTLAQLSQDKHLHNMRTQAVVTKKWILFWDHRQSLTCANARCLHFAKRKKKRM